MSRNTKGVLICFLTALIWGMAFPAQAVIAEKNVGAFTFNFLRCAIASILLGCVVFLRSRRQNSERPSGKAGLRRTLTAGLICGIFLTGGVNLQQYGIQIYPAGVASSGRAGFLTATYVVIVAVISFIIGRNRHYLTLIAAAVCLFGMYLLSFAGGLSGFYLGDLVEIIDALSFSCQILLVDHFFDVDGLTLSCLQLGVCSILSLFGMLLTESFSVSILPEILLPLLYCGVMSSGVGYTLQIIGQKYADPALASIAMSMESVFSALGGWLLLGQVLKGRELVGCALVFAAVIMTQIPQLLSEKKPSAIQKSEG